MLEILQLVGLRLGRSIVFLFVSLATAAIAARSYGLMERLSFIPTVALPGSGPHQKECFLPVNRPNSPRPASVPTRSSKDHGTHPPDRGLLIAASSKRDGRTPDKISAQGMDALSLDEKRRLNELSKLLR